MTVAPRVGARWTARVMALDETTGKEIWSVGDLPYSNICDVIVQEGSVYVCGYNQTNGQSEVQAFDVAVGSKRFACQLKRSGQAGLVHMHIHGERLLVVAGSALSCYDTATGKLKWYAPGTNTGWAYISAVDDSRVVLAIWDRQKVMLSAVSLETGKKLWDTGSLPGNAINPTQGYYFLNQLGYSFEPAQSTDRVLAYAMDWRTRKSAYAAYDGASGKLLWRTECPMGNGQPSLPVVGRDQAGAMVPGQGKQERRMWDMASGKLVDKASVPGQFGYLTVQEGVVLQVGQQGVERLEPISKAGGSGGEKKQ
jgi:outer membrane protein assembly factor BamB